MTTPPITADATVDLFHALGIGEHTKRRGDAAPDVTVLDNQGKCVRLPDQWTAGPLIVVFFRGGWCNYCNLQLRDWQMHHEALRQLGATLVAISPQVPERSAATTEDNGLAFRILSDTDLVAADAFGIAFTRPPELVEYFAEIGTDIPVLNGNGLWALPVPATYLIDAQGIIQYVDVEPDYRKRPNPADVLLALQGTSR
jgi:peroxiredoxin